MPLLKVKGQRTTTAKIINIEIVGSQIIDSKESDEKEHRSLHGLTKIYPTTWLQVLREDTKTLEIVGVGYETKNKEKTSYKCRALPSRRNGRPSVKQKLKYKQNYC